MLQGEKLDATENFDTYRILQRRRAISVPGFLPRDALIAK